MTEPVGPRRAPSPSPPPQHLERWHLTPDGPPMQGYMAAVWPVRGPEGQTWVLKVPDPHHPPAHEGAALAAWAAHPRSRARVVRLVDQAGPALLLDRLDSGRPLAREPGLTASDDVLAECLLDLGSVTAPAQVPPTVQELDRVQHAVKEHLEQHEAAGTHPLPRRQVDRALATLRDLTSDPALAQDRALVHFDLHHDNVYRDLADASWVVIDPLPHAGVREIELVAPLRNRWADVVATGDPDRTLRRRLARLTQAVGLDEELARMVVQASAVDNLLWLLPEHPQDRFVAPYRVLAAWT